MRGVSDRFLSALRTSHRVVSTVNVLYDGQPLVEGLVVVAGSVSLDRGAEARGRCDLTVTNFDLVDTALAPYGYELQVFRGIAFPDGTTETVSLGIFLIQTCEVVEPDRLVRLSGIDRSQRIRDARLEDPYQIAAGTNYSNAIRDLVGIALPGEVATSIEYRFVSTAHTTPLITLDEQADRWAEVVKMATSIGCELYYDGDGVLVLRNEPDPSTDPSVFTVDEGATGVLVGASLGLDRAPAYNRVIATGENAGNAATFRGTATDVNPASPSYYYGPFGRKPRFYASPFIASAAQATSAAEAVLLQSLGVARTLSFEAVVNPALEASDVITVRREGLGVDEVHVIDSLSIPLDAGGRMSAATRARQGFG